MFNPTVSPHDPDTVILTCDMTGQYLTRDGGQSWHMCNLMIWCDCFAFDPIDPKRIYAGANALYATDDFAETWQMLWPSPQVERETHLLGDEASPTYHGEGWPGGRISALAIDASDNSRLWSALSAGGSRESSGESSIHLSEDRAQTWRGVSVLPGERVLRLAHDGRGPGALWAITTQGVFWSSDAGVTWTERAVPGAEGLVGGEVGFSADGRTLLYVIAAGEGESSGRGGRLLVSADGGQEWRAVGVGSPGGLPESESLAGRIVARVVAMSRYHAETAYVAVSVQDDQSGEQPFGICQTSDAGETWDWVLQAPRGREPENYDPDWLTNAYGSAWGECPLSMGASPTDPGLCYATDYGRCYLTDDGGRTWRQVMNHFDSAGDTYTRGLDVTTCYGVHFDPHHEDVCFISYTDIGLQESRNGGLSWHHAIKGVPRPWQNTCYWMAFDPEVPGKVWSVWSGGHDYPRLKMFRRGDVRRFPGGVCISEDGGRTWRSSMAGMEEGGCPHIMLDSSSPAEKRTLYVTSFGRGVYKSVDDGQSWSLCNTGLPEENLNAWWLAGEPSQAIYLLVSRSYKDGQSVPGGIFRSTDGAASWQRLLVSDEIPSPNDLCLAPDNPTVMYAAGWPVSLPDRVVTGGIFKTIDAGETWRRLDFPGYYVYGISIDTRDPGVVYATSWHHGVYRSQDAGESWERLGGANFGWPHRVVFDPHHEAQLYLTTFGGSVWHGPKRGTPGVGPDILALPPVTEVKP